MSDQATSDRTAWRPAVGDWVTYRPHPGAAGEDGEVTDMIGDDMAFVRYHGDRTAKATYLHDLSPGRNAGEAEPRA